MLLRGLLILSMTLVPLATARAGLHFSGETFSPLPSQWRGLLLDQRLLRGIAVKPSATVEASTLRLQYERDADKLDQRDPATLSADEAADLGTLHVRLGNLPRAMETLRAALRRHPNHFALHANLGTAWHLLGDLPQAAAHLEQAVRLAPGKWLAFEEAHLKLVRQRMRAGKAAPGLDDLFGVRYLGDRDAYTPGKIAAAEMKKLPAKAVAVAQQLSLWLPADGALLWQLAELANAHGDVRSAASMMEGCVVQFGMSHADLRRHRHMLKEAADTIAKADLAAKDGHEDKHAGTIAFRSRRPLVTKLDLAPLPPISATGVNPAPWELFSETVIERPFKPSFPKYLRELDGKQVVLTGFMYPLRDDPMPTTFLFIEAPVGCWFCETPDSTGIVMVEMAGAGVRLERGQVRVTGRLSLNTSDPEDFVFALRDARLGVVD